MLPSSFFVLQPYDVTTRLMTSSLHSVTSFGPVIVPYISAADMYSSRPTLDRSADHRLDQVAARPTDYCLRQSADQVTWPEATPSHDDVIGYLDDENRESSSFNHGHAHCCDVISGVSKGEEAEQDGGRRRGELYPLYCRVCSVRLNGGGQAREHFDGRTHARRLRMTSSASRFNDSMAQVCNSWMLTYVGG